MEQTVWRQVVIQQDIVIRVPARSRVTSFSPTSPGMRGNGPGKPVQWKETGAPRCLPMRSLLGVQVSGDDSIDLLTAERKRLRARLEDHCRTRDFYAGFYMKASKDGMLCQDRDALQTRSGATCKVEKFRLMVPLAAKD